MKLTDAFSWNGYKLSRKRKALLKVLAKLDKTRERLEQERCVNGSKVELDHLELSLRTNDRHREKAKRLIATLDG